MRSTILWLSLAVMLIALVYSGDSLAAIYTVTNTNDSGSGSLRRAIEQGNASPGLDEIQFNIHGAIQNHGCGTRNGLPAVE